jgi:hypothetical protein
VMADRYDPRRVDPARDSALVVLAEGEQPAGPLHHAATDRVEVVGFDHSHIAVGTRTAAACFLMLQQCWYPGWHVTIDGAEAELRRANVATFGVVLPAGEHRVEFRFAKPILPWLLALSWVAFAVALGAVLFTMAGGPARVAALCLFVLLNGAMAWSLFGHRSKAERIQRAWPGLVQRLSHDPFVLNTDRTRELAQALAGRNHATLRADDVTRVDNALQALDGHTPCWWVDAGLTTAPAVRAAVLDRYAPRVVERVGELCAVLLSPIADTTVIRRPLFQLDPPGGQALVGPAAYTPAYRVPAADLLAHKPGSLLIDLTYTCTGSPKAFVVIERKQGGLTTDYETEPIVPTLSDGRTQHTYVVRNLRELRYADEEVGIYLWNDSPDTLVVKDFRVRTTGRDLEAW